MKVLTKTLTLILLLPIFLLNFPVILSGFCPAKPAMQKMACCAKVTPFQSDGHQFSKSACCCSVSKCPDPIHPLEATADLSKVSFSNSGKYTEVFSSETPFNKEQQEWIFSGFIESKFLSNLKIYSFVSSYLI